VFFHQHRQLCVNTSCWSQALLSFFQSPFFHNPIVGVERPTGGMERSRLEEDTGLSIEGAHAGVSATLLTPRAASSPHVAWNLDAAVSTHVHTRGMFARWVDRGHRLDGTACPHPKFQLE
jgi:hypothetical protein